ncbi:carbohydrate ABC transporter permease [Konateibacter massiliensis]|uniref:carbohydrate ABC transporter permease n=1 Tax=Konateibacter massiliensis TaxID=2002841 RepID=UPI000C14E814|nr:carbohydrate ABC transporter permease [Konateibacter massiliensis]
MKKYTKSNIGLAVLKYAILITLFILVLCPLIWLVLSSFKTEKEIIGFPPSILGTTYTLKSFARIFTNIPFATYIKNTIIFAGGSTLLAVVFDSMAGYAFARLEFKGKNAIFMFILLTMMVPFQVMMIPLFLESNYLGMLNTYQGLILPKATTAFGIFMMRAYFAALPKDLEEAARVDGLSEWGIYWKIMLPLIKPGIMTLAIFHLMTNWNDLLYPLMMTSSSKMRTLASGLALFVGEHATTYYGPQLAGALISVVPLLILYAFFQKYFIASAATSGMKD